MARPAGAAHAWEGFGVSWEQLHARLDPLLRELLNCPARTRQEHSPLTPDAGVYLFSEDGVPMYVGQARNLRHRMRNHTIPSARENQATFAFLLALEDAEHLGITVEGTRRAVAQDPTFAPLFDAAKERVREMNVQFAHSDDPELRTVFEVYAAIQLPTRYNSFETH